MKNSAVDHDVSVIGAGPYGIAAAAHLSALGLETKVFGEPMHFWANGMPDGMLLRSPRPASTISDPRSAFTLEDYEQTSGTVAAKRVARETFVSYGKWFHKNLSSAVDRRSISELRRDGTKFRLTLSDGSTATSSRVVVAAGIGPFRKTPIAFAELYPGHASHCYEGRRLADLGKRVAVIGAGQSALESAALLHEAGAEVEIVARISTLRWIGMHPRLHNLGPISKALYSKHDIGPIGISRLVAYPHLLRRIPIGIRDRIRARAVRSAGAPWLTSRLKPVKITTGCSVRSAKEVGGEVQLLLDDGTERRVDHVLMGTGYRVDIAKYSFLAPELLAEIQQRNGYPKIGAGLRSSVRGLHFTGAPGALDFGPLLYFVTGTEFASTELASWFRRNKN